MNLIRADILLTLRGKADSRSHAADLIKRGVVTIDGKPLLKPGSLVSKNSPVMIEEIASMFVSRGGDKLEGALNSFEIPLSGAIALDSGSSTGGFTDCLLQHGAQKVYAVDVGYGQLHWKLRNDPRVIVMERTNLRFLAPDKFPDQMDVITLDLSFISIRLVLNVIRALMNPGGHVVCLIKPQFEVGRAKIGSGGVVRKRELHSEVLCELAKFAGHACWRLLGIVRSPLDGPKGNKEFFFHLVQGDPASEKTIQMWIASVLDYPDRIEME